MALLDTQTGAVVIRVVYDGAPKSGKTTSVRALGKGLGASVTTPEEVGGRTLYFDWLDYTGGLFEGRRIRCQIVSVPGQASLAPRRRRLLEDADVVVFVGDSSPAGLEADRSYLRGLYGVLEQLGEPRVGIVFQANKRDGSNAVPLAALRSMLDEVGRIGLVESVATTGAGVRETFVFAVRLALDRVRELHRCGKLPSTLPTIDGPDDLLAQLRRVEQGGMDLAAASQLQHIRMADLHWEPAGSVARDEARPPSLPDQYVAGGLIWPPIDGRLMLNELASSHISLGRLPCGSWSATAGRWNIRSEASAVFEELEEGRELLISLARHYATAADASIERLVVLAADGQGRYRLWQISAPAPGFDLM